MANSKMTKKDWFATIRAMVEGSGNEREDEILAFIDHEVELLEKKSSKSGQTKTQKENENVEVVAKIENALREVGKAVTITELQTASEEMSAYSNQKLSALLKQMVSKGTVVRTEDKKKAYFSLAE